MWNSCWNYLITHLWAKCCCCPVIDPEPIDQEDRIFEYTYRPAVHNVHV